MGLFPIFGEFFLGGFEAEVGTVGYARAPHSEKRERVHRRAARSLSLRSLAAASAKNTQQSGARERAGPKSTCATRSPRSSYRASCMQPAVRCNTRTRRHHRHLLHHVAMGGAQSGHAANCATTRHAVGAVRHVSVPARLRRHPRRLPPRRQQQARSHPDPRPTLLRRASKPAPMGRSRQTARPLSSRASTGGAPRGRRGPLAG